MLKWNKKANVRDIFTMYKDVVLAVIFFIIFGAIVLSMGVMIKASALAPYLTSGFDTYFTNYGTFYDYLVYIIFVSSLLFSIIAARKIPTNSVFFIIAQFGVVFIWAITFVFQSVLTKLMQQTVLTNIVAQFPGTLFFINNTYIFLFIYTIGVMWALYSGKDE